MWADPFRVGLFSFEPILCPFTQSGWRVMKALLALAIAALAPRIAAAQTTVDDPPPTVNVGAGIGLAGRYLGIEWPSTVLLSAQFPLTRFVVVEATGTRWSWHRDRRIDLALADEHWRTTSAGANVLLRAGRGRLAGSIGIGAGLQRSSLVGSTCLSACETAAFASSAVRTSPSIQFAGGADVRVAPRLVAFGSLLMIVGNEGALATTAGLRIPISTPSTGAPRPASPRRIPSASRGKRVRLTLTDGTRHTGRLASFSTTEVVVVGDNDFIKSSLKDVRRLERVGYGVLKGAWAGTAAGVYVGIADPSTPGDWLKPLLTFSAVGAGIRGNRHGHRCSPSRPQSPLRSAGRRDDCGDATRLADSSGCCAFGALVTR